MRRNGFARLAVISVTALAVLGVEACNKSSPTEPERSLHLVVAGGLENAESGYRETIKRLQILIDGKVVRDYSASPPAHDIFLTGTVDVDRGQHKLEVRIVSQTVSPSTYKVSASIDAIDDKGNTEKSITFPNQTVSLATDQGVVYSFQL